MAKIRFLILTILLVLMLALPLFAMPGKVAAEGSEIYALVQLPDEAAVEGLKGAVEVVYDCTGENGDIYAIIDCSAAQLSALEASGHTVIQQCDTGDEATCLPPLFDRLNELVPPRVGFHSMAGPDAFGYYLVDNNEPEGPVYNWQDISGTGTIVPSLHVDDNNYYPIPIGFTFKFYGVDYTQVSVVSNGVIAFGGDYYVTFGNGTIPSGYDLPFIAPWWDDLDLRWGDSYVYYQTLGTAPHRIFVVQYQDVGHFSYTNYGRITFQVILYEGSNEILMQYQDTNFGSSSLNYGGSATVGIQQDSIVGLLYSYNTPVIAEGLAIRYFLKIPTVSTNAATDITAHSATLNMSFSKLAGFNSVRVRFAYKKSAEETWSFTDWVPKSTAGNYAETVGTGLDPNTQYDFKAQLKFGANQIEGNTLQFTTYPAGAGGASVSPSLPEMMLTSPANMTVKYLAAQPQQAKPNQPVTVYANIANGGDESGKYTATLKINGQVEETKTGSLSGHAAVPLKFNVLRDEPGTYLVDINGQNVYFTIVDDGSNRALTSGNFILIGFIICAVGVVAVSLLLILRRRSV